MKAEAFASAHGKTHYRSSHLEASRNEGGGFRLRAPLCLCDCGAEVTVEAAMKAEAFASAHPAVEIMSRNAPVVAAMKAEAFASAHLKRVVSEPGGETVPQ